MPRDDFAIELERDRELIDAAFTVLHRRALASLHARRSLGDAADHWTVRLACIREVNATDLHRMLERIGHSLALGELRPRGTEVRSAEPLEGGLNDATDGSSNMLHVSHANPPEAA